MKIFEVINQYRELLSSPMGVFQFVSSVIVILSVLVIFASVIVNFAEADNTRRVKKEKKSIVETGTMTLFFFLYYGIIKLGVGSFMLNMNIQIVLVIFGLCLVVLGAVVNVMGRFSLGKNWANQIKVYDNHSLVQSGMYRYVRHPLYASLIWMFFGGSLIYHNYIAFLLNLFIFIPFMHYRAKQEERELSSKFKEYKDYKNKVWMFFPKF